MESWTHHEFIFPVCASLNDSMVDAWRTQNVQTFTGQSLALQVGFGLFEEQHGKTLGLDEMWPTTLIACGLWTNIKESLLPHVMINPEVSVDLERTLKTDEVFMKIWLQQAQRTLQPQHQPLAMWQSGFCRR